jgi:hypothetical protein
MNPAALLALIGELYAQVSSLTEENQRLRQAVEQPSAQAPSS